MSDDKLHIPDEKKGQLLTPEELRELSMRKFYALEKAGKRRDVLYSLGITRQDLEDDPFIVCRALGDALEGISDLVIGSEHGDVFMATEEGWWDIEVFPIRLCTLEDDYNWVGDSLDVEVRPKDPDGSTPLVITDYSTKDQFSWTIWVKGEKGGCPVYRENLS